MDGAIYGVEAPPPMLARATPGETWPLDNHAIAPVGVGVALAIEVVGQGRISRQCQTLMWRCPEWLPGLLLGRHGGQGAPDIDAIAPGEVGVALVVLEVVGQGRTSR